MRSFVIVVDMQRDFVAADGALPVPGAEEIVAPMQGWLGTLDPAERAGVLLTFDTHVPEVYAGSAEGEQFPLHCVRGEAGWRSVLDIGAVDPAIPVWRLEKGVFDMWAEPGLTIEDARDPARAAVARDAFFDELEADGVTEVVVVGVAADYCVRWAVDGLVERGFAVILPAGLTRGIARPIEQVVAEDFAGRSVAIG